MNAMMVPAEHDIVEWFDGWNNALASGDPDVVCALYDKKAVLLPTTSDQVRSTPAAIRGYFEDFLKKQPTCKREQSHIRVVEGMAIHSGVYRFQFASGEPQAIRARFTFVYQRISDRWLIIVHHSSQMPEGLTPSG